MSSTAKRAWDPAGEEARWRKSTETAKQMQDRFGEASEGASGFILLCLAELDGGIRLLQSDCFSSRSSFLSEVRRLITEPTTPSRPVASIEDYKANQKQWLEFILLRYEHTDMPEPDAGMDDWETDLERAVAKERREHDLESKRHQRNPDEARDNDNFCEERLQEGKTEDAIKWIKNKAHTLGERDWSDSKRLVERLAAAGSVKTWACKIDTYKATSGAHENTGHLVIKLPKEKAARAKILKMIDRLARETGYSGPFDDGQQYAYVKLD